MVELPPLRFVKETSKAEKVNMEAVVIDIDEQEIEDVEEVRRRLEGVDDLNTEADVEDISGGGEEEGLPSDEEGAIPDLEDENAVYAQVTKKKKQKDKKAEIDPEKAKQEIAELEGLIEKANVAQDLQCAAPPAEEEAEEDQEWDEEMAKRRRRSNSYEDTIKNMDPDLVRELGLAEGGKGDTAASEDERDTASRIEDRANEKAANGGMESNGNGARRRSRSRSRSRPPNLETVEENYSKEYQGWNISKTDGFNNFSFLQLIYGCHRHSYRDINGYFQFKPTLLIKSNIPGISVLQARRTSALEAPRHQGVPLGGLHSDDSQRRSSGQAFGHRGCC